MHSTNKNVIINSLGTVLLHGISFIVTPFFAGKLGTENYGVYSLYFTWVSILSIVFSLNIHASIPISKRRFSSDVEQKRYLSSAISLVAIVSLFFSALLFKFEKPVASWRWINMDSVTYRCLLITSGFFTYIDFYTTKCIYNFKPHLSFLLSFIKALLFVGPSIILLSVFPKEINYLACILGYTISCVSVGLFSFINVVGEGRQFFSKIYWKYAFTISLPLVFHSLSTAILGQSDRIMIQYYLGKSETGIYSLSVSFSYVMIVIWTALNQSWSPFFFDFIKNKQFNEVKNRTKNFIELFTSLCIGFALLCPEVFHIYAAEEYWSGTKFVLLLTINTFFTFIYSLIVNYEMAFEHTKIIAIATIISSIANILMNYFLVPVWGSMGAVLATVFSHVILFVIHYNAACLLIDKESFVYKLDMFVVPTILVTLVCLFVVFFENEFLILRLLLFVVLTVWESLRLFKRKTFF